MKNLLLAALLAAVQLPAFANGSSTGPVSYLFMTQSATSSGAVLFAAGTPSTPASCNTQQQWALDLSQPFGKNMYAMLLSAQALGQTVNVVGNGTCSAWPDRETPFYIYIQQ